MNNSLIRALTTASLGIIIGATAIFVGQVQAQEKQYLPALVYRTGPYASGGLADGFADYVTLINERDGGINGVKIELDECETAYSTERGIECYERLLDRGITAIAPHATGIAYALIPRARQDNVTIFTMGYGRSDASYGPVLDWVFNIPITYWSSATIAMRYIAEQEGGWDNLKGKTIVHAYHDSAYGREPLAVLRGYAEDYGFTLEEMPIAPPGVEQQSVWLQIRRMQPDWVSLYGWGVMTPTALRAAASMGIDPEHIVGSHWTALEESVKSAGDDAIGFKALSFTGLGKDFKVYDDLQKYVYDKGLEAGDGTHIGSVVYNRYLVEAAYIIEAWRQGQANFGERVLNGEETKWAWKNLSISEERTRELGLEGLMPPVNLTCMNHEGKGSSLVQQWDGEKWVQITDFMEADMERVMPLYRMSALKYAESENIPVKECD